MIQETRPILCLKVGVGTGASVVIADEKELIVPDEYPVSLTVNGIPWLTFTCTPALLEELASGFLFNEGIIDSFAEIASIHVCDDSTNIDVWLEHEANRPTSWRRTSGCSGGLTSDNLPYEVMPVNRQYSPEGIVENMQQLFDRQELYKESGGLHCSAISDGNAIRFVAEDIGRHNTLDKLAGQLLLNKETLADGLILTTGRISSEMLQKSMRLHAAMVISRTSPTSWAVTLAERAGITLIGYARRGQFKVYSHPERLLLSPSIHVESMLTS